MRGRAGGVGGVPKFLAQEAITVAPTPDAAVPGAVYFSAPRSVQRRRDDLQGSPPSLLAGTPQALTAALYTDTDALFSPALTQQIVVGAVYFSAQRIAPRRRDDLQGSPPSLLGAITQALTAALYSDADVLFAPAVAQQVTVPGAVYFSAQRAPPRRRDDLQGSPGNLLAGTAQALAAALYTDADALFAPVVSATYGLVASLYTDAEGYFTHALNAEYDLAAALYIDPDTLFAPTVAAGAVNLTAALYADPDSLYVPVLAPGAVGLVQSAVYSDADAVFVPSLAATYNLTASLYTDPDGLFAPALAGLVVVPGPVYFSGVQALLRRPRDDPQGSPRGLLAGVGVSQTMPTLLESQATQAATSPGALEFGGGAVVPPGAIARTTRFMVNLGTLTSRQH